MIDKTPSGSAVDVTSQENPCLLYAPLGRANRHPIQRVRPYPFIHPCTYRTCACAWDRFELVETRAWHEPMSSTIYVYSVTTLRIHWTKTPPSECSRWLPLGIGSHMRQSVLNLSTLLHLSIGPPSLLLRAVKEIIIGGRFRSAS